MVVHRIGRILRQWRQLIMANVIFHISNKAAAGKSELLVRFYASRTIDLRAHTRIFVPRDMWNDKMQRLIIPRRVVTDESVAATESQQQLDALRTDILNQYTQTPDERDLTKQWLLDIIDHFHNISRDALIPLSDVIDRYVVAKNIAPRTGDQYEVVKRMLKRFADVNKTIMYVGRITPTDIAAFEKFLRHEEVTTKRGDKRAVDRSQNTINSKLRRLRALCHYCVEIGLTDTNPFDRYKIPADVYGTPVFLTLDERDKLYATHFDNPALERQKDIFVFQCFIGCRVSDLIAMTPDNVTEDGFIQYIQHKLRKSKPIVVRVPLTDTAKEIVERYAGQPDNRLLPFISQDKYNDAIKRILKDAGIDRMVLVQNKHTYANESKPIYEIAASHLARRTFMANMFKKTRSERIVSSFTGHARNSAAFSRYAYVDDEMKRELIHNIE